jgi:hypothetical protein
MGVLECQLPGVDTPRILTDVGAFWLSQFQGRSILSYRTRAHPGNLRNLADAEHVVPKDLTRWLLFGPPGRPFCGIDQRMDRGDGEL